jgi:hypothetical protein
MQEKRETGEMGWRGGIAGGGQRRNGEMAERSFFGKKHSR